MTFKAPRLTKRAWLLAVVLLLVALTWFAGHRQINRFLATSLLLRSPSPPEELFDDALLGLSEPPPFLRRCWATGKVPHRQLVAGFLCKKAAENPPWFAGVEPLILEGAIDPDMSVRELAVATLQSRADPHLFDCVRAQLTDPDPLVRQLGVDYLRRLDARVAVPVAIGLLDDSDLRVVTSAEVALMGWTGQDFGVRTHLAVPANPREPQPDAARLEKIRRGIERRKEWWQMHAEEFSPTEPASSPTGRGAFVNPPVQDFALPDLHGKLIHFADFRGRTVLVNFWATWCTACLAEIPELVDLQKKLGDRVVVLGVALDSLPDEHGHGAGEGPEGQAHTNHPAREAIARKVARVAEARGINYPVLLDPDSSVGRRFNGGELPTTVIIDAKGVMRRRFIGERSTAVFEAMLNEAAEGARPSASPALGRR